MLSRRLPRDLEQFPVNNILLQLHFIYPIILYCMRAKNHYSINIKCDCSLNFYFLNDAIDPDRLESISV